ncbi:MAG: ankyrin repeat domain-containing protein [Alphaproteobacteria bacterium]|nr:ankyrin repeat domain-containing protein [Alphaproteobacteria bacterium]
MKARRNSLALFAALSLSVAASAQTPPSPAEIASYSGLHAAVAAGDVAAVAAALDRGAATDATDGNGRTALHVAAFLGRSDIARLLLARGADPNALDRQRYDAVTVASVRDDAGMIRALLAGGANPRAITSPYDGTALIAASHLGHVEPVRALIAAGAPLDHVNNLGWTALIEAIVLGDGGPRHTEIVRLLVAAGASVDLADREGASPRALALRRGYREMVRILEAAGAR